MATDKGEQIAADGSAQDRNKITEQLQSLKAQLAALKRAVEGKRAEHLQTAEEHRRLVGEIETDLDWLASKEAEVKSRPLLRTSVEDVEAKIADHQQLDESVRFHLSKASAAKERAEREGGAVLPGGVLEVLSQASALLHSMPAELEERRQYLQTNKELRTRYDSLVERLNNWVEEAQLKLRPLDAAGVDFANVESDLEEHKRYFGGETKLRDLLDQIHETANKIWASLDQHDQDKVSHEQEFFNQLVKNSLNSAHSRRAALEESAGRWRAFRAAHTKASAAATTVSEAAAAASKEKPSSLAAVKGTIGRVDTALRQAATRRASDVDPYNDLAKEILSKADVINRRSVSDEQAGLNNHLREATEVLKARKESLASLALQWDDLEQKSRGFTTALASVQHKVAAVDTTFRSLQQMKEIKSTLKVSRATRTNHPRVYIKYIQLDAVNLFVIPHNPQIHGLLSFLRN